MVALQKVYIHTQNYPASTSHLFQLDMAAACVASRLTHNSAATDKQSGI